MITAVRNSLRDLAEVSMTHMLLVSDADKEFPNLTALGMRLVVIIPTSLLPCGSDPH